MAVYYILLAYLAVCGFFLCDSLPSKWGQRVFAILSAVILSLLAGFRFLTGHDYAAYMPIFMESSFYPWTDFTTQRYEKGYYFLGRLLTDFSIEPYMLFLFFGIFFAIAVVIFCHRYSSNLWLSLFAFVCFGLLYNSFNFMRQFAAMCILMWALRDIKERRPVRFLVLVLLASCFHLSAFIFLPFYLIFQIPLKWYVLAAYIVISGLIWAFSIPVLRLVTTYYYKSHFRLTEGSEMMLGTDFLTFLGFAALLVICLIFYKQLVQRREFNLILINCLFFATFFEFIGLKHAIISRVAVLFMTPAIILLVPELANVITSFLRKRNPEKLRKGKAYALACVALMVPMLIYHAYLLSVNYNGVVPYRTLAEYYGIGGASWTN